MYISEKQKKIIDAYLHTAVRTKKLSDITMRRIADAANLTPQSIYRKHFKSVDEIIQTERAVVIKDISLRLNTAHDTNPRYSPFVIIADEILPLMYENRLKFKILYRQDIDPDCFASVENFLKEWLRPFLKKKITGLKISKEFLLNIEARFILTTLTLWIAEENPLPISIFRDEFLELCKITHLANFIDPKFSRGE